jgi:hypothetical protein
MRRLLAVACLAFPPDHRARQSNEVVDTALLAANGSAQRAAREALSLVAAGLGQRLRAEAGRSVRDGAALLAGVLALVNLAVAAAGIFACLYPPRPDYSVGLNTAWTPYVVDWWWIGFVLAAMGIVVGLALGNRRLAVGAASVNLGLVGYDALFEASGAAHMNVFTWLQTAGFPAGGHWLAAAVVLALATAVARLRRLPLSRLPVVLAAVALLVVLSRETSSSFVYLAWPLAVIVVLAMAFGALAPRLAVLALGGALAALPSVVAYLTRPDPVTPYDSHHHPVVIGVVAAALALSVVVPLAQLARRRLT